MHPDAARTTHRLPEPGQPVPLDPDEPGGDGESGETDYVIHVTLRLVVKTPTEIDSDMIYQNQNDCVRRALRPLVEGLWPVVVLWAQLHRPATQMETLLGPSSDADPPDGARRRRRR